jgi:A/G-specific adenine glycosylase
VLEWGRVRLRDLPWRATRDPWAVLVSEVMAQQTQVQRVVPKWERFLDRWPTPAACAAAGLGEVIELWSGLGYPRRARDLHAAAGVISTDHGGQVPDDLDALLALPGVGPYTASAVLAFAFERDVGVVDTNIARVLARWSGRRMSAAVARAEARAKVPAGHGWWWNQSLMELGARCCRPRDPVCGACPLGPECAWNRAGHPEADPAVGSALVSGGQARYAGSDREARGRLLAAVTTGPIERSGVAAVVDLVEDPDRAAAILDSLVADGLVVVGPHGTVRLP